MKKINKKEKTISTKKSLIESSLFFVFFLILIVIYPSLGGFIFLLFSGILMLIFAIRYINENKD